MFRTQLTALLAALLGFTAIAQAAGLALPIGVTQAIAAVQAVLTSGTFDFASPTSFKAIWQDVEALLFDAKIAVPSLADHLTAITADFAKFDADVADAASGQPVILGTAPLSVNGELLTMEIFAIKRGSTSNVAVDLGVSGN